MHKDFKLATPTLAGSTELVVVAPIKPGFVPSLDSITYKTRVKLLLAALHAGRKSAHEYQWFRAVSDAVERVGAIHSLRVLILEPQDSVLLSVNFDGSFEAYVRVIWQKAARLLDLIFCNTVDHVSGWDHSLEEWTAWMRSRTVETPFYYAAPSLSRPDVTYLRMFERFARRDAAELATTRLTIPDAETTAWTLIRDNRDLQSGPFAVVSPNGPHPGFREGIRQGLQGLAGAYRLASMYPPGTPDGVVLHRAARELLPEFARMLFEERGEFKQAIDRVGRSRFGDALDWFAVNESSALPPVRVPPALPAVPVALPNRVQAGILSPPAGITHGCLCLVTFDGPVGLASLLDHFVVTAEGSALPGKSQRSLAFTFEGLRAGGVSEQLLAALPLEFRQGMAARAGVLGDVHGNHPRRWLPPVRNWPQAAADPEWAHDPAHGPVERVPLESVHAVVQLRLGPADGRPGPDLKPAIAAEVQTLFARTTGVTPVSLQWLTRLFDHEGSVIEHFGFGDGESQPEFDRQPHSYFANQVHLGEVLVGRDNAADYAPDPPLPPLLRDGSFFVVRKLRQDVEAFESTVARAATSTGLTQRQIKSKMMGRDPLTGEPLVTFRPGAPNDFDYGGDPTASQCPMAAHIRKANPRIDEFAAPAPIPGARAARLMRRSLSYVPPTSTHADPGDKGLIFMAYNASLGEQFEVVQRWLAGGNSSAGLSTASDPFLGTPEDGRRRYFRFEHAGATHRMHVDGDDELGADPKPLVSLHWGLYALAPSLDGLQWLREVATALQVRPPWDAAAGQARILQLQAIEREQGHAAALAAWKAAVEDTEARADFSAASVWAAVREVHGGVLRSPLGVLIADPDAVDAVLTDTAGRYTVAGYQQRLKDTIGPIFLGMDAGPDYRRESAACNAAIGRISFDEAFDLARRSANAALNRLIDDAVAIAEELNDTRWELTLDIGELVEPVLADLIEAWFGIDTTGGYFERGGFRWTLPPTSGPGTFPVRYPGSFLAPSRHTFQPEPGPLVHEIAVRDGRAATTAMANFLAGSHKRMTAPVGRAVLNDCAGTSGSVDFERATRTLVGAVMGFAPTTDGNLRRIATEWIRTQTLWRLRSTTQRGALATPRVAAAALSEPIVRAMQLRPVPELVWRTATAGHVLPTGAGTGVAVAVGDRLVMALVSATQRNVEQGNPSLMPAFGGDRTAAQRPTHACPGYSAAMGAITGVLSALVDTPHDMRPGPRPDLLAFDGEVARQPIPAPLDLVWYAARAPLGFAPHAVAAPRGTLLAWGDSWFYLNHPQVTRHDLGTALANMGYDTASFAPPYCRSGLRLDEMADVAASTRFCKFVQRQFDNKTPPKAILLDGGGNDLHDEPFFGTSWLSRIIEAGTPGYNSPKLKEFLEQELAPKLTSILTKLTGVTKGAVPILVHGYDHPIPDNTGFPLAGPWLWPVIEPCHHSEAVGRDIMRVLIDELNKMIIGVVAGFSHLAVSHLKLTGTLARQPGYGYPVGYRTYWVNELHPSEKGYAALADCAATAIEAAHAALAPVGAPAAGLP